MAHAGLRLLQRLAPHSSRNLAATETVALPSLASSLPDCRRCFAEDPKPGARGKGGGQTDKFQPQEEHTKDPSAAEKKQKDDDSEVGNPIEDLNANTVESVNTPDDKEAPKNAS